MNWELIIDVALGVCLYNILIGFLSGIWKAIKLRGAKGQMGIWERWTRFVRWLVRKNAEDDFP